MWIPVHVQWEEMQIITFYSWTPFFCGDKMAEWFKELNFMQSDMCCPRIESVFISSNNIITIYFKLFLALIHLYLLLWNLICKALIFFSSLHVWQKHVKYSLNFETHYCWNLSELPYFSSYSILDNQSEKICISIKKKIRLL